MPIYKKKTTKSYKSKSGTAKYKKAAGSKYKKKSKAGYTQPKKAIGSKYKKKSKAGYTPPKKAYTYSLNPKGGKKYVGYTTNIKRRLGQHFSGNGAKVTQGLVDGFFGQECRPISVNHVQRCTSVKNAKKAETIVYNNMKKYHGKNKVRGAGHTKRFSYG